MTIASTVAMNSQTLVRTKVTARRALLQDHLGAIAAIALAELSNTPELAVVRRVPRATACINTLLSRAEDVAKAVQPFADTFVANGLPADFLAQLVSATKSLNEVVNTHKDSRVKVVKASSGIQAELAAGRRQVRILDKQVRMALHGDKPLLDAWRAAIRLPSAKQQIALAATATPATPAASAITPTPTPAPAPAPVATAA
jgi:hypothetical protein